MVWGQARLSVKGGFETGGCDKNAVRRPPSCGVAVGKDAQKTEYTLEFRCRLHRVDRTLYWEEDVRVALRLIGDVDLFQSSGLSA